MLRFFTQNKIRYLREFNKFNQKQLAFVMGITVRQYRRYEMGEIDLPISKAISLACFYNVSLDYLIGRSSDPNVYGRIPETDMKIDDE